MVYAEYPGGLKRQAFNVEPNDINAKIDEYKIAGAVKTGYRHMPVQKEKR